MAFTDVMADATVSGRVYADSNSNGVFDSETETGLEGFTVFSDTDGAWKMLATEQVKGKK